MPQPARSILHLDMDAFFASVEQLDNPELRGKPLLIGSDRPRGVVTTASYEARPYGCHSAQPMAVAKRLCPHAFIVPTRFSRYRELSQQMFQILDQHAPLVEPLSIDEAFMDVTGCPAPAAPAGGAAPSIDWSTVPPHLLSAVKIAIVIQHRIHQDLGLTASIGIAPNKFLAKLASDLDKPNGLTVVTDKLLTERFPAMPVSKLWGIGPKSAKRLEALNIRTISDLRRQTPDWMAERFGSDAQRYMNLIWGKDDRPVTPDSEARSISSEETFETDLIYPEQVRGVLLGEVEEVAHRLRKHNLFARTITLKIRSGDFKTITRSAALDTPTQQTQELWNISSEVFDTWANKSFHPVRLIGMAAKGFSTSPGQLPLFTNATSEKQTRLDSALDQITQKFGKSSIHRAR